MIFSYEPQNGIAYARAYALYEYVPEERRLFFYDSSNDCANFVSQCVWAAYGGWVKGVDVLSIRSNRVNTKNTIRMAPYIWYGSKSFSGSNKWCRVVEFFTYAISTKQTGPLATRIAEGDWATISPTIIKEGDVLQLVVQSYIPNQYGHSVYVTKAGHSWEKILICCHSYDRLDVPLSSFSQLPDQYPRFRILRFRRAVFNK